MIRRISRAAGDLLGGFLDGIEGGRQNVIQAHLTESLKGASWTEHLRLTREAIDAMVAKLLELGIDELALSQAMDQCVLDMALARHKSKREAHCIKLSNKEDGSDR